MTLPIIHHPDYQAPLAEDHRFPMAKYGRLRDALRRRGLLDQSAAPQPGEASAALLSAGHDPAYVARVLALGLSDTEQRRIGLPRGAPFVRRARLATAGSLMAAEFALQTGLAGNTAGGSHHAGLDYGAGFCTFNDVAVAAGALLAAGRIRRALVVDCDVHQGDGTARIFANDPRVFTFSIHGAKNFPARKAQSDLDLGVADGLDDTAYLAALSSALERALGAGPFDLAFYNAGVDVHGEDRLGRLALTDQGVRGRDRLVLRTLRRAGLPVAIVIGGGYSEDAAAVAERHAIVFEEAAALREVEAVTSGDGSGTVA
ncbi:MAG: histone deacetylase [Pseudomonadota bacterium]